jgi:hypothetical protein
VEPGEPLPWEPGGRLAGRPAAPGRTWRHEVFGGIFRLGKVRGTLAGESALFTCTVSASGALLCGPAVSECAWAVGQLALGDEAALLEPAGIRVRSYQTGDTDTETYSEAAPLAGYFAADLARVSGALRESAAGLPLLTFFGDTGLDEPDGIDRVDVRRQPLTVRDGCAPDRMPTGRWPADAPLVLSEQFAVNEIFGHDAPLFAVDTPPGGTAAVFNDLVAAIVTERARALAGLPSPDAAFGAPLMWGPHSVAPPAAALTGFEILVAAPRDVPGLSAVGTGWRERAADAGYFASTARLAGGESSAMIRAHLGDTAECRAFTDRFWHGRVHGSEALFAAGEPMRAQLRYAPAADWPGAVAGFQSALAEVGFLSSERKTAADILARFSALEQACEDAYSSFDEAQARVADLAAREPDTRASVIAAEERRRAALEDLQAHQGDRPGLAVAMSTGLRAGREWYAAHAELRAAFDTAARSRDEALGAVQALRAELASARKMIADAHEAAGRLAASMDALQAPVAAARKRWGDHVPEGPSYAETEDTALIERRENSAPWSDPEFAAARAGLFLAALTLHRSMICANARVLEANLAAWADMVSGDGPAGRPPPEVALAAWQSFFLVVPVVSVSFHSIGSLLAGLGRGSVGWLLAAGAGDVPPRHVAGALWRANRAVLAGTSTSAGEEEESALSLAAQATRFGTWLPDSTWTGLPLHPRPGAAAPPPVASPSGDTEMLRAVLSDLRQRARSRRTALVQELKADIACSMALNLTRSCSRRTACPYTSATRSP